MGDTFTRNAANGPDVLAQDSTSSSQVSVLAQASCTDSSGQPAKCAPIAQTTGTSFPWAIRSSNLTYVGEIPFSYLSQTDRYVAFSDLLFPPLAPPLTPPPVRLSRLRASTRPPAPPRTIPSTTSLSSQAVPF